MHIGHIEIFVSDAQTAKAFYIDALGFSLVADEGPDHVWLRSGPLEILLRRPRAAAPAAGYAQSSAALVLYTDDLPATLARLAQHGIAPRGCDGSARCPTFTDPDGNWFQLVNPAEH